MNIQCRTTTIFKIYYIYTGFSKMHVDSWWDSYLEHGGTPKTSVYIYIQRCTYDSNIRFGKFLLYELYEYIVPNIQCRTTTIFKIYYIYTGFSKNARRQLGGFLLRTRGNPKTSTQNIYEHICSKQWSRISTQNTFWNSKTNVLSSCPALYISIYNNIYIYIEITHISYDIYIYILYIVGELTW